MFRKWCSLEPADMGLLVPSVSLELRSQILQEATRCGFGWERQLEMLGRAASEMVLQLLGGCRRSVLSISLPL